MAGLIALIVLVLSSVSCAGWERILDGTIDELRDMDSRARGRWFRREWRLYSWMMCSTVLAISGFVLSSLWLLLGIFR